MASFLDSESTGSPPGQRNIPEVGFSPGFATPCSALAVISLSIHCNCSGVNGGNSAALFPSFAITIDSGVEKLLCAPPELLIARRLHCTLLRFQLHPSAKKTTLLPPPAAAELYYTARIAAPPRPFAIEPALPRGPQPPGR